MRIYGDHDYQLLMKRSWATENGQPQFLPRRSVYGSKQAVSMGLVPMLDLPDLLVSVADFKAVIADCHAKQVFAMYHQRRSGVLKDGWYQGKFGFCWAYGLSMATMDCRALENQEPVRLAPFSLGWLTSWRNRGYYCDEAIAGARERGIASAAFVPEYVLNPNSFGKGWEEDALKYRPLEWWDTRRQSGDLEMIRQCLSILATGRALYVGYNWWGHALEVCGMDWDETQPNNIVWLLRNSHGEDDVIRLTGAKGIPDEAYGVRATSRV
jgi:hypothetical protein